MMMNCCDFDFKSFIAQAATTRSVEHTWLHLHFNRIKS